MEPFILMSDYDHVTNIQNGRHFYQTIAKIEHNVIDLCYINLILYCPFLRLAISGIPMNHFSTDARLLKPINIQNGRHFSRKYVRDTVLCLFLSFSIRATTQYWHTRIYYT